jgi:hypothetical protein
MRLRTYIPQGLGNPSRRIGLVMCLAAACHGANFAWALPGTTNLARFGTATATGADFGASIEDAIDGNRDGTFGNGSVFYANAIPESPPLFYQVDLGVNAYIDRVQILRRTDESQAVFGNMRLTIYDDDGAGNPGAVSFTQDYLPTTFVVGTWGTTDPGASATGGAFGRHVRLERLDNNYWLTFAEFEVIGATSPLAFTESNNIAAGKSVTTSSVPGFGATIASGNDGNIDGSFGIPGYRPVYHSSTQALGEYWQVDLGAATQLDHLQLFARGDHYSTTEFKVSVLDTSQAEVGSFIIANAPLTDPNPGYDHLINTAGLVGMYIRIETTKDEHLVFTELRAFEGPGSSFPIGDYSQDGVVDQNDYTKWRQLYGTNNLAADGNSNGVVDTADYVIWRNHAAPGSGSSLGVAVGVPEPSAMILALWLLPVVFRRRR